MSHKPVVLFLCVHNSGRSLAAKVLLEHYTQGRVEIRPAGSEPASQLNLSVVAVLKERGLDTSREFPRPLTDNDTNAADVVVTMGCADSCPFYSGKRYLDWQLEDPASLPIEQVRPMVEDIDRRVQDLLMRLVPGIG
jgi:arsenate reductase